MKEKTVNVDLRIKEPARRTSTSCALTVVTRAINRPSAMPPLLRIGVDEVVITRAVAATIPTEEEEAVVIILTVAAVVEGAEDRLGMFSGTLRKTRLYLQTIPLHLPTMSSMTTTVVIFIAMLLQTLTTIPAWCLI